MAGPRHPADKVGGDPVVPAIHVLILTHKDVDARDTRGHDEESESVGLWQFSSRPGATDMIMRNSNNGGMVIYDINNN
jgi:hypothetical protein